MSLHTIPFRRNDHLHTLELPDDVDPTQSSFHLAVQDLHSKDHQWTSTLAGIAEVAIPAQSPIQVPISEMTHPPVPLADHTGHRCFRLHLNVPARETLARLRTLNIRLPEYLDHLRLDLWILTRD
jgi:hypothetical protein